MELHHINYVAQNMRESDRRDIDSAVGPANFGTWVARQFLHPGMHWTVIGADGIPVACFGFNEESAWEATFWLIATERWKVYVKSIAKAFDVVRRDGLYRRIQAYVDPMDPAAVKFAEWLGGKLDGLLPGKKYDGSAMRLYSIGGS